MSYVNFLIPALFVGLLTACATEPNTPAASAQVQQASALAERNWDKFNKSRLEQLIARYGKDSPDYNPAKPPYAVFDWDNTMIFLDIQEATLIYQLQNLKFNMTPTQMGKALRMNVPSGNFSPDFNNAAGQPLNIDLVVPDAVESYTWLYENHAGLKGKLPLDEVKENPHYTNFVTKVRYLYEAIGGTFDVSVAYPWVLYLLTGLNEQQVRKMTTDTTEWQLKQPIEKVKWISPESIPGKAGIVSVSWKNGLRLIPEMQDTLHAFRAAGIDIWICTASFVDVVKEISSNPKFGYDNPDHRVVGMELERDENGIIQNEYRKGYDQTQGKGKTTAIKRFIVPKYGYGPIFVAGDSEGDQNMMQDFPDTKLVLIVNRLKGKDIAKLSKIAHASYGNPDAKIILQGRDDNRGSFVPSQEHITLGAKTGQVLK